MKIPRATHSSLPLAILWGVLVMSLSLASYSCSGSGDGTPPPTASTASGTNVVTGIMPASSTVAQRTEFSFATLVADAFQWLTTTDSAFAVSKGRVEIVGTAIKAYPVGNGRFELLRVPAGPITILFVSPDNESGTLNLFLPSGGNAVIDLGKVTIWKGRATPEYEPSHENSLYPGFLQARGAVSGLSASFSTPPANGVCEPFVVAGVTFCFDEHTQFTPPLSSQTFQNTNGTNEVAVVVGAPTDDPNSIVFRAKRIQRNHGAPSANDNTVEAVAPITDLGQQTITLFGTPLKPDDNDPNTSEVNEHAITFNTAKAKFNPRSLENQLSRGLVVGIETPKNNHSGPAVTTTQTGVQVAEADRVRLIRLGNDHCTTGEFIHVQGKVFSPHAPTQTFGLTTTSGMNLFVQVQDSLTRFDEPLTNFDSLKDGMIVDVFALPPVTPGAGLRAVLIDEAADMGEIEIRGVVSSVDTANKKFVVAGITFCYDSGCVPSITTEFVGLTPPPQVGQFVEILGAAQSISVTNALRVELEQDPRPSSCSDGNGEDDQSQP
ncbi:MAG TPA: DUF5666 domain-containing protein [Nitrospiraceae bacterium]|nr:DUF5666 domain-containing protein [Nitrospiraceae bacterium]